MASSILLFVVVLASTLQASTCQTPSASASQFLVEALDLDQFKGHIQTLSSVDGPTGGSRYWNQPGNDAALDYLQAQFESYGYEVHRHAYVFRSVTKHNIYATKIGSTHADQMYIVSAHMDSVNFEDSDNGFSFAPGANDDASGTSLVLEVARVFALPGLNTKYSVRFILWNNEETGMDGSRAYVEDRRSLQGLEEGVGAFPEPTWLGVLQHDQLLWDHGVPATVDSPQIPDADIDIEYKASSSFAAASRELANHLDRANANGRSAAIITYPTQVTNDMCCTDSVAFQNDCPSISIRDNRRRAEIGEGSHPTWHTDVDVYETFSELDFSLGFDAVRTTVGAVADLVGATLLPLEQPSAVPSSYPSQRPSNAPTSSPSIIPTSSPSHWPSNEPMSSPSITPSSSPSDWPSNTPTTSSSSPSRCQSNVPTSSPSIIPTSSPSQGPSNMPIVTLSSTPTSSPLQSPSTVPTVSGSITPTSSPSQRLSSVSTASLNSTPQSFPSQQPMAVPAGEPTQAAPQSSGATSTHMPFFSLYATLREHLLSYWLLES